MAVNVQLAYGSNGSSVKNLQKLLNQNGYNLDEDGIFGSKTQAAVKDYQKKNNLAVDGIVGNNTWGALNKASSGAKKSTTSSAVSTTASKTSTSAVQNQSYKQSDAVSQAQALLNQQLSKKPGAYQSAWQTQLDEAMKKILNREKFSYDLNGDALYQQYKDQYILQGQQAMMDTMGQAAALTGGYGNSYAQTAGQQAYNAHLQELNDIIPELYQMALSKYQMEGDVLYNQAALIAQQEEQDYGRYRDQVGDWQSEVSRLQDQYYTERDYDYGKYVDDRSYQYQQDRDKVSDEQWAQSFQYQQDRDAVADEQWQAEFDEAKRQYDQAYALENGGSSGSGSSSDGDSSDDGNTTGSNYNADTAAIQKMLQEAGYDIVVDGIWGPKTQAAYEDYQNGGKGPAGSGGDGDKLTYSDVALTAAQMRKKGASKNDIYQYISSVVNGSNYKPTNSVSQDLAELKSGYVGSGR